MELRQHEIGDFRIRIVSEWDSPEVLEALTSLPALDEAWSGGDILQKGHQRVARMALRRGAETVDVVVKTYKPPNIFTARERGKANRAFDAAVLLANANVATPPPVAVVERRRNGRRAESHLICEFVPALSDFRAELNRIFFKTHDCEELITLIETVALAVRKFHDAGVVHRDLGNQNIGLRRAGTQWQAVFLDLDRTRIFPKLTEKQRGKDLARLKIPSDILKKFLRFYGATGDCLSARSREEFFFTLHSRLRPFRHPLREYRLRKIDGGKLFSFCVDQEKRRNHWIWDERSAQAIPAFNAKDRRRMRPMAAHVFFMLREWVKHGVAFGRELKKVAATSFSEPVSFDGKIGVALDPNPETWEEQLRWLSRLQGDQKLPLLLRVYHHRGKKNWQWLVERAGTLRAAGHPIAFALVQDREAILNGASWREMVNFTIEQTHHFADFYEVGHATNRGKWGVWDFREYARLLVPALEARKTFPEIKLTGPACIDFDLHSLPVLLALAPAGAFDALSQHLYVDRRGMPENFQGKFDTVGKCAVHRTFAKIYGIKDEKLIVSEVNWPIKGTQHWSPVGSPYTPDGPWASPPSVSEDEYARYMARYILLTLASGHVSRVYWWRLAARGYGLVDDMADGEWRARPAFSVLQNLLTTLKGARFERRRVPAEPGFEWDFEFSRADGSRFSLCWSRDSLPEKREIRGNA